MKAQTTMLMKGHKGGAYSYREVGWRSRDDGQKHRGGGASGKGPSVEVLVTALQTLLGSSLTLSLGYGGLECLLRFPMSKC